MIRLKNKKILALLVVIAVFFNVSVSAFANPIDLSEIKDISNNKVGKSVDNDDGSIEILELRDLTGEIITDISASRLSEGESLKVIDENEKVEVIVELESEPLVGRVKSFSVNEDINLQVMQKIQVQENNILSEQKRVFSDVKSINPGASVTHTYTAVLNGFATEVAFKDIDKLRENSRIKDVYISNKYEIPITYGDTGGNIAVNSGATWDIGYEGDGMLIAIIDTGVDYNHPLLSSLPTEVLSDAALTGVIDKDEMASRMLSAGELNAKGTADNLYKNDKVVFGYDYADGDDDPMDSDSHGTHVAGISSANESIEVGVKGVAPNSQLMAMKVFSAAEEASDTNIIAAIDDAVKLGANVINMSLATDAGFSDTSSSPYGTAYAKAREAGVFLSVAASNAGATGLGSWGGDLIEYPYCSNPEYGTVGAPSTFDGAMSVASSDNKGYENEGAISSFSSRGTTPELNIKPEITAIGGNVKSTLPNGYYGIDSGTSMAAPQVAGAAVLMQKYVDDKVGDRFGSEEEKADFIYNLMMSSAEIIIDKAASAPYSVQSQGAGAMNLEAFVNADAVLYDGRTGKAKLELGDNLNPNSINMSFVVENISDAAVTFDIEGVLLVDKTMALEKFPVESENLYVNYNLQSEIISTINAGTVTVPAGGKETVTVSFSIQGNVDDILKKWNENGYIVDGFISLTPHTSEEEDGVVLSIPFLGFVGDWLQAPVFDPLSRYQKPETASDVPFYWNNFMAGRIGAEYKIMETQNIYIPEGVAEYGPYEALSFNPNGNGYLDVAPAFYLLRNISYLTASIEDENGNEVKNFEIILPSISKGVYDHYKEETPYILLAEENKMVWDGSDDDGNLLPDGRYTYKLSGAQDYSYSDVPIKDKNWKEHTWGIDVTLDTTAPVFELEILEDDVILTVSDNNYLQALQIFDDNKLGYTKFYYGDNNKLTERFSIKQLVDLQGSVPLEDALSNITIFAADYALNETIDTLDSYINSDLTSAVDIYAPGVQDSLVEITVSGDALAADAEVIANLYEADYYKKYSESIDGKTYYFSDVRLEKGVNNVGFKFAGYDDESNVWRMPSKPGKYRIGVTVNGSYPSFTEFVVTGNPFIINKKHVFEADDLQDVKFKVNLGVKEDASENGILAITDGSYYELTKDVDYVLNKQENSVEVGAYMLTLKSDYLEKYFIENDDEDEIKLNIKFDDLEITQVEIVIGINGERPTTETTTETTTESTTEPTTETESIPYPETKPDNWQSGDISGDGNVGLDDVFLIMTMIENGVTGKNDTKGKYHSWQVEAACDIGAGDSKNPDKLTIYNLLSLINQLLGKK